MLAVADMIIYILSLVGSLTLGYIGFQLADKPSKWYRYVAGMILCIVSSYSFSWILVCILAYFFPD